MPYYPEINLLFIHIPKTGGTSIENFLKKKYKQTLYSGYGNNLLPGEFKKISLQHQFYSTLYKYGTECNITFDNNLKIITSVRNPYDRIISALFWDGILKQKKQYTQKEVYLALKLFVEKVARDNHAIPQYLFLIDDQGIIPPNIRIIKCEELSNEMTKYGFVEYIGKSTSPSYKHMLNTDSIKLINNLYRTDFELFNYEMIKIH